MKKLRLDQLVVERGLADSRERARRMILAGQIRVGPDMADKPGKTYPADARLLLIGSTNPYVSRGGLKLAGAFEAFGWSVPLGVLAMDVGASTGGFTHYLLEHGAGRVLAVDTGKHQIHEKLRTDPRIELYENTNARYLTPELLRVHPAADRRIELVVIDVSFISLRLILPAVARVTPLGARVVALVKPQFEAGRKQVGSGGIVRDPEVHREVLTSLAAWLPAEGFDLAEMAISPILGGEGNVEFLFGLVRCEPAAIKPPINTECDSTPDPRIAVLIEQSIPLQSK